ncbi:MAG: hypothetical protein H8D54_00885 [Candidatus Omnitrophica bacterium]|nr:hypothetical protein [Candidatus Omnitrophota bacterium]
MRKNILTTNNVENYKVNNFIEDLYRIKVVPIIKEKAKQIDDDIRECIKLEIKTFGSIVRRYGDWAKFITKEMIIAELPRSYNCFFNKSLYYRGKFIRGYGIKLDI